MNRAATPVSIALAATLSAVLSAQAPGPPATTTTRTVWDGVYNVAQAARGETSYVAHCASCHREDLTAYDSVLRGRRFMEKYREATVHLLFDKTKDTMPRNAARSLSDQTYIDIVSYVLKMNEFPPGADELSVEAAAMVKVVGKGGSEPVPDFSLVRVVGCLDRRDDAWQVTNTTDPVRTGRPRPDEQEPASTGSASLRPNTFRLLVSPAFSPESHAGRVVEVRGFLIRRPNDNRINLTSLATVGPDCTP